ncbi:NAD(P)-dependent alcohol dehydrogenase [Knoellia locipacati]|uniref:NAD(P)-dependent alcohol dehydrogenase n=1 Tax=Knoellia locipacati TaxID=882824 RepID=UPI00384C8D8C
MRAVVQDHYGSPSDLRCVDLPVPRLGDDEVLVRVRAASVHPDVWHVVTGRPAALRLMGGGVRRPKQPVPGTDFAGEVVAVGSDVSTVGVGDDVFGETLPSMQWVNGATWAEFVAVQQDRLLTMPAGLTHEQACTLPTAGIIALQAVREQAQVSPGQQVLVNGAAGGVGSLSVQIAKADGATVTAVDDADKQDLLRALGADHVIDFTRDDFTRGDARYDVVVDIPGNHPFSEIRRALAPHGRYVLVGHDQYGREGRRVLGSIPRMVGLMARSAVTDQIPRGSFRSRPKLDYLRALAELAEAGHVRPVVGRTFSLEEAGAALEHLASGRALGRVVLTPAGGADSGR